MSDPATLALLGGTGLVLASQARARRPAPPLPAPSTGRPGLVDTAAGVLADVMPDILGTVMGRGSEAPAPTNADLAGARPLANDGHPFHVQRIPFAATERWTEVQATGSVLHVLYADTTYVRVAVGRTRRKGEQGIPLREGDCFRLRDPIDTWWVWTPATIPGFDPPLFAEVIVHEGDLCASDLNWARPSLEAPVSTVVVIPVGPAFLLAEANPRRVYLAFSPRAATVPISAGPLTVVPGAGLVMVEGGPAIYSYPELIPAPAAGPAWFGVHAGGVPQAVGVISVEREPAPLVTV